MEVAQGQSAPEAAQPSTPAATPATPPAEERNFRQSEVNDIVKKAKYGAVEDYKRLQVQQPEYAQTKQHAGGGEGSTTQQQPHAQESEIRRLAAQEAQRLRDEWVSEAKTKSEAEYAQRTVQSFWNKISPGKEKFADFDEVTKDIEYSRFPNVVQLLAEYVDNAPDVLYELGKDRIKMANLESLSYMSPKDAIVQAQRLSKSLKDNEAASNTRLPNEPLSKMRPSNTGTDNGVLSVKDFRSKYRA
jgi:hypothetical protein